MTFTRSWELLEDSLTEAAGAAGQSTLLVTGALPSGLCGDSSALNCSTQAINSSIIIRDRELNQLTAGGPAHWDLFLIEWRL